jgi:DNA-binding MurR/RpiR family transcriptional regulator
LVLFTDHLLSPLAARADRVVTATIETGSPFVVMAPALAAVETVLVGVVDTLGGAPRSRMERYDAVSTEVAPEPTEPTEPDAPAQPFEPTIAPEVAP